MSQGSFAQYLDDGQSGKRHRELAVYPQEGGRKKLSLVLNDTRFAAGDPNREFIVLPLGHGLATVSTSEPRPADWRDHDHFFLPLILRRYATSPADPEQIADLRDGWVYVYRNGYLWRELQVVQGTLRDVNLKAFQGQDERPATGESDRVVIVPYKVNGEEQQIEIAYSEVQWSWARINALGGMDPDPNNEPRLASGTPMPEVSTAQAAENRSRRLQPVTADLTVFLNDGDAAHVEPIDAALPKLYSLALHEGSALPVVRLSDALGIAKERAAAHQLAWQEMADLLADLQNPDHKGEKARQYPFAPWFDSAVLANRYFFGKIPDIDAPGQEEPSGKERDKWVRAKSQRDKWKKQLSKPDIDLALGVAPRREIREKIAAAKQELLAILDPESAEEAIALIAALDDYFTRPVPKKRRAPHQERAPHYGDGWRVVEGLIAKLGDPACALDAGLETAPPDFFQLSLADPGARYLRQLAEGQGGHGLHVRLFPQAGQSPLRPDETAVAEHQPDFKPQHIHSTFMADPEIFADFFGHFARVAGLAETSTARDNLLRLVNAALGLDLVEKEISLAAYLSGDLPDGDVLLRSFALNEQFDGQPPGRDDETELDQPQPASDEDNADSFQPNRRAVQTNAEGLKYLNDLAEATEQQRTSATQSFIAPKTTDWSTAQPRIAGQGDTVQTTMEMQGRRPLRHAEAARFANQGQMKLSAGGQGTVQIYHHDGQLLGAASVRAFKQGKAYSRRQWRTKVHTTHWEEIRVKVTVSSQAKGLPALAKKAFDHGVWARGVLPILVGVEVWNFQIAANSLYKYWGKDKAARAWVDLGGAATDLLAISGVVTEARVKYVAERATGLPVDDILKQCGPWADKIRFAQKMARGLGAGTGLYSMGLSLHDMIENLYQGDDAAMAHGLMAGGFAMVTVAEASGFLVAAKVVTEISFIGSIAGGPWLWIGFGTVFAGAALLTWVFTEDTPLEEWLANGPFSMRLPGTLTEENHLIVGQRSVYREIGTEIVFDETGALKSVPYPGRRFALAKDGTLLLKRDGQPPEPIGRIGDPFNSWYLLADTTQRFGGYDSDKKRASGQMSRHGNAEKPLDRFARWREHPRESYLALADAIYRPRIALQVNHHPDARRIAEINIHIPHFIEEKTLLFVELWEDGAIRHQGIETFTATGSGPRTVRLYWPVNAKHAIAHLKARVRMDLYGNGDVWLPNPQSGEGEWIEAETKAEPPRETDTRRIHY